MFAPTALGGGNRPGAMTNLRQEAANMRRQNFSNSAGNRNFQNANAADALKVMMRTDGQEVTDHCLSRTVFAICYITCFVCRMLNSNFS